MILTRIPNFYKNLLKNERCDRKQKFDKKFKPRKLADLHNFWCKVQILMKNTKKWLKIKTLEFLQI